MKNLITDSVDVNLNEFSMIKSHNQKTNSSFIIIELQPINDDENQRDKVWHIIGPLPSTVICNMHHQ